MVYLQGYYDDRQRVKLEFTKDRFIIKDGKLHPIVNIIFLPDMKVGLS